MRRPIVLVLIVVAVAAVGAWLYFFVPKTAQEHFERGNAYFAEQKYAEAVVEYRSAVNKDARYGEARLKLTEAYERLGDPAKAYEQAVRAADLLPDNLDAQLKAGTYLFRARKFEDAAARADGVLQKDPANVQAMILKANASAGLQDLDAAIAQVEEAIRIAPDTAMAYTDLGAFHALKGNLPEAERTFRRAVEVAPKSVDARLALAYFLLQQPGRTEEAEAELKAAHALEPKNVQANRMLALFYMASKRAPEAEPYLKSIADTTKDLQASLFLADYYTASGRRADATALLDKLAATEQGFAPAKIRLAAIRYAEGKTAEAHKTLDEVLARNAKDEGALVAKGRFLMQEGRTDEALAQAQAAVAANPRSANAQFLLGSVQATRQDTDAARLAYAEVLKINPRAVAAQVELSRLELARGPAGAASAVQYAQQALTTDRANPTARLMLVRALLAQGDTTRAEGELKTLLAQHPNVAAVHASEGNLQLLKRDPAAARRSFERALELDANSVEALAGLVTLDFVAKKPEDAKRRVDARVAATPKDPSVLVLAANVYRAAGDAAREEQLLLRAIEAAPGHLRAYEGLGALYLRQQKLDEARQKFEELAKRQPKPVGPHTMVAMILQMQGKAGEARQRYEKVLGIDPQAPVAANNLAWMYAESKDGNLDTALQLAQTAKSGLPDLPEVNDTLGWIYYKKDLPGLAVAPLQQAAEKDPKNPTYQFHLGMALAKKGDAEAAKKALRAALALSPTFPGAEEAKKTLAALQ